MCGALPLGSWRTSLVVQALDPESGASLPVAVGLVETAAGGVPIVLRVGEGRPMILPLQDASQLALNVNDNLAERLKVTAGTLGGDDQDEESLS